jgi:hypothetical protein
MQLASVRLVGLVPFDDLRFSMCDDEGVPRPVVVVLGGGGVGKTTLLAAIASTRPGHAVAQSRARGGPGEPPFVVADWMLADDDVDRPHPLRVASPNAQLGEDEGASLLRRREQALFDKRAEGGGFVLVSFSGMRWASRSAVMLTSPERTITRYDPRAPHAFDDATRADVTRETKQALSYSSIAAALSRGDDGPQGRRFARFDEAMRDVVSRLTSLVGLRYLGADPTTLEPSFESGDGRLLSFDELSTSARCLAAFGALTLRALFAGHARQDTRHAQAVALIDDAHLHLDASTQRRLIPTLREALPRVQWIVTTSSTDLALGAEPGEVFALRRMASRIELHEGELAIAH